MEPTRAEVYVQKLKELNAYMAGMIQSIHKDVSRLETARLESRKHFSTAKAPKSMETSSKPFVSPALCLNLQSQLN